jgi:cytosine/adenosine deaminase-related metal-dependent hydrolase
VSTLIRNATILTMNDAMDVVEGDVWIEAGLISAVGAAPVEARPESVIDAGGAIVLPGFIQTHVHLCQTLFRGLADDRPLLAWLRERVWPLEAAHDARTLGASARLAAAELLLGGTTAVLTMETVHDTDAVFDALEPTGLRAVIGKCMMDVRGDAPPRLCQPAREAIDESLALARHWNGAPGGRLRAALAPRFAISCSRDLLDATAAASLEHGLLVHTHASEQRDEIAVVRAQTGLDNLAYLDAVGLATARLCAAHCVWVTEAEQRLLAERHVKVLHCPGSNLKLGSGIAPVPEMRARGVSVSLGADGAACNNSLDMFQEMRLAATLQAMRLGPGALSARDVVWMATREGARALGLDAEIGSIEPGKRADVIVVDTQGVHQLPGRDAYSLLVYASRPTDVRLTMVDGQVVARDGELTWEDRRRVGADARDAARRLVERAHISIT